MPHSTLVRWSDPKLILVVTNLTEDHTFILHCIHQARVSLARVLLVHTISPRYLVTETSIARPNLIVRDARAKLDELAERFRQGGVDCEPMIVNGPPEEEIPLFAKSRIVDRIIVAARAANGVERLIGGDVAEVLMSRVDIPVCTIGRQAQPDPTSTFPPGRILLATSLQPGSQMLARFASILAELHQSHLTLLHVLDSSRMTEQDRVIARFDVRKKLLGLIPAEAKLQHQPVMLIPEGDPTEVVSDAAGTLSQDLIILGGPSSSLFSWLLGTGVVHRVIDEAKCPIITIRSPTDMAPGREYSYDEIDADASLARSIECSKESSHVDERH